MATRILMRGGADPRVAISAESVLAQNPIGNNIGNALYLAGAHRVLSTPGTEITVDGLYLERNTANSSLVGRINDEYDHLVLPLANALRGEFLPRLERLTELLSRITIPVTLAGIGLQEPIDPDALRTSTRRDRLAKKFVAAVLDHSASIGVRGHRTADYLRSLGFGEQHVEVIGCPSMYQRGRDLRVEKQAERIEEDTPFSINSTAKRFPMIDIIDRHAVRYRRMTYTAQDRDSLALLLWGQNIPTDEPNGIPGTVDHLLYREDRIRHFLNIPTWIEFMRSQRFSVGTRIHGNVVAMLAGTPGMVLAHDSRTQEMAEFFDIPVRDLWRLPSGIDVNDLYAEADYSAFNRNHPARFDRYTAFLEKNGLEHVFQPGRSNPEYERAIAPENFPGPAHTLYADDPQWRQDLISRLAWLRQSHGVDSMRTARGFHNPFPAVEHPDDALVELQRRVSTLEHRLASGVSAPAARPKRKAAPVLMDRVIDRVRRASKRRPRPAE